MAGGLTVWKNKKADIAFDADNLFWAITPNYNDRNLFIPGKVIDLYKEVREKLSKEIKDFRFSWDLTAIYIDPTDKCNSDCLYCYVPKNIRKNGHSMDWEELNFILKKIQKHFKGKKRKQVIIFHASEPLLVKGAIFRAIEEYAQTFKFGLQTNAMLLEKEDVDFLKKHRVGVGISLDSFSSSVNNRLRPSAKSAGNFSSAIRAIEWFNGYPGLNVITTVSKMNVNDLPGIVKLLHSKKVPCVLLNPMRFTRPGSIKLKPDEKLLAKYFIKAVDKAVELSRNSKRRIIVGNFANTILAIIAPLARRLMCDISPCGAARCFFTITAKGKMIPCGEFIGIKGFSGGSIFNTSIAKSMGSKAFKKIRGRFVEKISECDICDFRNICGAPCPAELHSLGNMYQKSVFCNFYKEIIHYAFKMIADGKVKHLLRNSSAGIFKFMYNLN